MTDLPESFTGSVSLPDKNKIMVGFKKANAGKDIKEMISDVTVYSQTDMKLFFDDKEIEDCDTFENLVGSGFSTTTELRIEVEESFEVSVELSNGKKIAVNVGRHTQISKVNLEASKAMLLPRALSTLSNGEKELCETRTVSELDMNSGTELIQKLTPLSELYVKQDSLTSSLLLFLKQYVNAVPFWNLHNICSTEFFEQFDKVITKYISDTEISRSLMSVFSEILYRGADTSSMRFWNAFYGGVKDLGVVAKLNEKIEKLISDGRKLLTLSEEEKESVMSDSFVMQRQTVAENKLRYSTSVLVGMIKVWVKKGDAFVKGKHAVVALRCLCDDYSLAIISFASYSFFFLFYICY
jgi:hypothetical protein